MLYLLQSLWATAFSSLHFITKTSLNALRPAIKKRFIQTANSYNARMSFNMILEHWRWLGNWPVADAKLLSIRFNTFSFAINWCHIQVQIRGGLDKSWYLVDIVHHWLYCARSHICKRSQLHTITHSFITKKGRPMVSSYDQSVYCQIDDTTVEAYKHGVRHSRQPLDNYSLQ